MSEIVEPQTLIRACLQGEPFAWEQFVDHFLPAVTQTIARLDQEHSLDMSAASKHRITMQVFRQIQDNQYALLRELEQPEGFPSTLIVLTYRTLMASNSKRPE